MITQGKPEQQAGELYSAGFWHGMGVAALVLSLVTYLSMLGFEKAILAVVLGALAVRGSKGTGSARRLGIAAVVLGAVFIISAGVFLLVMRERVAEFIALLQKLS